MSSLCIELPPSAARKYSQLNEERRRYIELQLIAQLSRLLGPVMDRNEVIRGLEEISGRAEARAKDAGLTMEELNRMIDESK
jgi:hypothetical protein